MRAAEAAIAIGATVVAGYALSTRLVPGLVPSTHSLSAVTALAPMPCSPARAEKKGLKFRSLETTIRDTLEWQKKRPEDKQVLKAGLTMQKEAELLASLRKA